MADAERVWVWQNSKYETQFSAPSVEESDSTEMEPVAGIYELTPYGMMLASLGSCTTIVLNSYAENHKIPLEAVEIRLEYDRVFKEDCDNCENIRQYQERIREEIRFEGSLSPSDRKRLETVAHACPIYKMFLQGIEIETIMIEEQKQST